MNRERSKSAMWGRIFLTVCALLIGASLAFAGTHKMSNDLAGKKSSDMVNVIVQFNQVPTSRHHQKVADRGGKLRRQLGRFRGAAYSIPASQLASLAADPEVTYISPDRPLSAASTGSPTAILDYHTDAVNAPAAWAQGLDGTGVGVAIIDSGIADLADIHGKKKSGNSNVVYSQDFTGAPAGKTVDQYGHGTHVAGIIAGTGANNFYTFQGIAGNANLINLRVLDQNGAGTDSEVIAAIQTAIQLQSTYNIRVISLSVGRPVYESYTQDPLCQAVEQAWQAGIVVVVAAGNYGRDNLAGTNGYGTITAPGNDPYAITVGAVNTEGTADRTDDVPASYSSKGPTVIDQVVKPDLVAPGNAVISLYTPGETLDQETPGNEVPFSAFKGFVQSSTATDAATGQTFSEQADIFTVGAGELDIQAALANTDLAPAMAGSALSPLAAVDSNGNVDLVVNGSSILGGGGDIILWGSSAVWGDNIILWGSSAPGSDIILWGSSGLANDIILWGSSLPGGDGIILWGSSTPGGDIILWGSSNPAAVKDK